MQRQMLPSMAARASATARVRLVSRKPASETTKPEKQNPHWGAPSSTSACWMGLRPVGGFRPSMVTRWRPASSPTGSRHDATAR